MLHFNRYSFGSPQALRNNLLRLGALLCITFVVCLSPAAAQQPQSEPAGFETRDNAVLTRGTVVSVTGTTMIVRAESGEHLVFVTDRDTTRPDNIPEGSRVRIVSVRNSEGVHLARSVIIDPAGGAATTGPEPVVPSEVRRLEGQIARQARRFRLGVKAGVGLDPEVLLVGAHVKTGPFFHRDVWFRPNVEVGFGEVTKFGALNLEAIYRLPVTERQDRWSVYVGAGPGLNFVSRNFEEAEAGEREIDFDDFDFDGSLNFLAGVESRGGMFMELKSTTYSVPHVKISIGYNF